MNMRHTPRLGSRICAITLVAGIGAATALAQGLVYDNITSNPNILASSLGYASTDATEFGGIISPNYSVNGNNIYSATVELANFATSIADFSCALPNGCGSTYSVPMSLTLYNVNLDGSVGSAFATSTVTELINYAPNSKGDMQQVLIPISAPGAPGTFIYGLSFTPSGPSDKLNFALSGQYDSTGNYALNAAADTTTVGATLAYACSGGLPQTLPSTNYCDSAYWNTTDAYNAQTAPWGTLGTPGVFSQDTSWVSGGLGAGLIAFDATPTATPEPATLGLIGLGLMAFTAVKRAKNRS
jgi:hypothetical protein